MKVKQAKTKEQSIANFYNELKVTEEDVLSQVRYERSIWDYYYSTERDEIEADLVLLRNQKKQKDKIWDTTLFNVHTALVARSYQSKPPIVFKWDKNWIDREIKMLNSVWKEDNQTPYMKALILSILW